MAQRCSNVIVGFIFGNRVIQIQLIPNNVATVLFLSCNVNNVVFIHHKPRNDEVATLPGGLQSSDNNFATNLLEPNAVVAALLKGCMQVRNLLVSFNTSIS